MKRNLLAIVILITCFLLTGCLNNKKAITYTTFNETFKNNKDYLIINQTIKYEDKFERCLEANGNNTQFLYYEFKTEKQAKKYLKDNYQGRKKYRYLEGKTYTTVKCTDNMYFYAVQIDKSVVVGNSPKKSNKKEIKKIFKELGY